MSDSPYIRVALTEPARSTSKRELVESALLFMVTVTASGALYKFGVASIAWALIYAATLVFLIRDHASVLKSMQSSWALLCFPAFCLFSVFWSIEADDTLRHALQYTYTALIAFWIGSRVPLERLFAVVALALSVCVVVSVAGTYLGLVQGQIQGSYAGAERYFVGLYTQKNVFGNVLVYATLSLLVCAAMRSRKFVYLMLALAIFPVLWMTKSTTSILHYIAVWTFFPVLALVRGKFNKVPLFLALAVIALLGLSIVLAVDFEPVNEFLAFLGKDSTLTGRTIIWERGADIIVQKPYLGLGYQAFWEAPAYASDVMMIRAAVLESIGGFHNGYLEAIVATGIPGVVLYALLIVTAVAVTVRSAIKQSSPLHVASAYFCLLIASRTFTESSVYYQHDLDVILLVSIAVATIRDTVSPQKEGAND